MNKKNNTLLLKRGIRRLEIVENINKYSDFKLKMIRRIPRQIIYRFRGKNDIVEKVMIDCPMIGTRMISKKHIKTILINLKEVLDNNIEGDIVELGCNAGQTSLFIQKLLDYYQSRKNFHVYDSFEGLPEKHYKDKNNVRRQYDRGACRAAKENFIRNFKLAKIKLPKIHTGWFSKIPDCEYPQKIAFAFFDGDFYTSIMDSFNKVYSKMVPGSRILIHDYKWSVLPGVEKACTDFLENKPEKGKIINDDNMGVMQKAI